MEALLKTLFLKLHSVQTFSFLCFFLVSSCLVSFTTRNKLFNCNVMSLFCIEDHVYEGPKVSYNLQPSGTLPQNKYLTIYLTMTPHMMSC